MSSATAFVQTQSGLLRPSGRRNIVKIDAVQGREEKTPSFGITMIGASALAVAFPGVTSSVLPSEWLGHALALAMFGAACSLRVSEVRRALMKRPKALVGGVCAQFVLMPSLAFLTSRLLSDPILRQGVMLVGCCPGGCASNVVALIAKADVALSVAMTATSTLSAAFLTPKAFALLQRLDTTKSTMQLSSSLMNPAALYTPLLTSLFAPTALGIAFNHLAPAKPKAFIQGLAPTVSSFLIAAIVAKVIADVRLKASTCSSLLFSKLLASLLSLHAAGFALGFLVSSKVLRLQPPQSRAISIEVGMQNSALAVVLATSSANAPALAALPGATSACVHSLIGAALASFWRSSTETTIRHSSA